MKTLEQHVEDLKNLQHFFGFDPSQVEQKSIEWHMMRLGVITASPAECLIAKKRGSKGTEYGVDYLPAQPGDSKRTTYMLKLISQIATMKTPEEISARPLEWGNDHEEEAREAYEAATMQTFSELPFIYKDSKMRAGISPDGLNNDGIGGLELKCPWSSKVFIEFALDDVIKHEYRHQCQFSMWVTGREYWDKASFDPRMMNTKKLHFIRIERDEKAMAIFDESVQAFNEDMDKALASLGMSFGEQWLLDDVKGPIAA